MTKIIHERLFCLQDTAYAEFQKKLIPTVDGDTVIGVRTPELRKLAKELIKDEHIDEFLNELPHAYFDENQLHAFLISEIKDFNRCIEAVSRFLPYVDNWATCDQLSPKVFKKHKAALLPYIKEWIQSDKVYTVRFAIGILMQHFLDDNFETAYVEAVAEVPTAEYYVHMMVAWYFATGLAKQYDAVLPYLTARRLDRKTHNKAIQKACESYRITPEQKAYLKTLKY